MMQELYTMAPPLSEQKKVKAQLPHFDLNQFDLEMIDIDPEVNKKDVIRALEPKFLEEKRQVRIDLLRKCVNKTFTSVSKNKSTSFNQLTSPRVNI